MTTIETPIEHLPTTLLHDQVDGSDQLDNYTPLIAGDVPIRRQPTVEPKPKKVEKFDLSSESAFPSLSSSGPRSPAASCWTSSSRVKSQPTQTIRSTTSHQPTLVKKANVTQVTDVLELTADRQIANLPERPDHFKGNTQIIQDVMGRTNTNIIASTNLAGTSTYLIQGASGDVKKAKYELMANIAIKL